MEKTNLWQLLIRLSPLERKHLGIWLNSPAFNRREEPVRLYDYLQQCLSTSQLPEQQAAITAISLGVPENLWKRQKKSPDDAHSAAGQALRLVMSELLHLAEQMLSHQEAVAWPGHYQLRVATAYRKRGMEKAFFQQVQSAKKAWERQPFRDTVFHEAIANIAYEEYQWLSNGQRTIPLNLQSVSDTTDIAYFSKKLREACFALTHQAVYNTPYDLGLLETALNWLTQRPALLELPAIGLYYYCYHFLKYPADAAYFNRFKAVLLQYSSQLPPDEQRNLHLLALNYCIKKINQRENAYIREAFVLYQSALKSDLLLENGVLSHFAYNNIVAAAIMAGETDWAEQFIREYAPMLERKHREASMHLNLARVAYHRRQTGEALLYLQQADYKDRINNLIAKTLQLKIYYETDEWDVLETHLENMRTFIRRQRDFGYHQTNYLNIVRFAKKLIRLNHNSRTERIALRTAIEKEPFLTEKDWFLAQIAL